MPIQIKCECGKALRVKDEFAGKKVRCPGCSEILLAPPADDAIAPVLAIAPPRKTPPPLKFDEDDEQTAVTEKPTVKISAQSIDDDEDDSWPAKKRDRDDDDDRAARRKRRRRSSADSLHTSPGGTTKEVLAGVGLMIAGVALFVGPLMFGIFLWYSIALFIAGIMSVVKGALNK